MQNNYAVILYTNLGQTGSMPLLLSAIWLTTAGESKMGKISEIRKSDCVQV